MDRLERVKLSGSEMEKQTQLAEGGETTAARVRSEQQPPATTAHSAGDPFNQTH